MSHAEDEGGSRGLSADDLAKRSSAIAFGAKDPFNFANGKGRFKEADRRFLDLREPDGEVVPLVIDDNEVGIMSCPLSPSSSSAITNSASVTSALSRLLTGTMVCVDCNDSAIDTGREFRLPMLAAPGRMVLKLIFESLFERAGWRSRSAGHR